MTTTITVYGQPFGKQRPKATQINGFTRVYTPKETAIYENLIKLEYRQQCNRFIEKDKQIKINIKCFYEIPLSYSHKKTDLCLQGVIKPLVKPDIDNVAKLIMDALNGVAYADDKQVIELKITKQYDKQPRIEITLEVLNG